MLRETSEQMRVVCAADTCTVAVRQSFIPKPFSSSIQPHAVDAWGELKPFISQDETLSGELQWSRSGLISSRLYYHESSGCRSWRISERPHRTSDVVSGFKVLLQVDMSYYQQVCRGEETDSVVYVCLLASHTLPHGLKNILQSYIDLQAEN